VRTFPCSQAILTWHMYQVDNTPKHSEDPQPCNSKQAVEQAKTYKRNLNPLAALEEVAMEVFEGRNIHASLKSAYDTCTTSADVLSLLLCIATNWKVDLVPHCNGKDLGICVTVAGRQSEGGHMLFPQPDMASW
jgi:hypothetical protein